MELAVLDHKIPVKSIPEEKLNEIILTVFIDWLSGLLSLSGETSSNRLEFALPAIKKHCWSMGFDEIKNMFELYADNKLSLEPVPNYFDRILFGKIVQSYKQFKKVKPSDKSPEEKEKEYKSNQDFIYVTTLFDFYIQNNNIPEESFWVYSYLESKIEDFKFPKKEKTTLIKMGKDQRLTDEEAKQKAKRTLVMRYFDRLYAKGKHIKDLI